MMSEVSLASKEIEQFQVNVNMLVSPDARGGHRASTGLSAAGEIIDAPLHRHRVALSTYRIDVGLQYLLNDQWMLQANVPYAVKDQRASIEWIDPVTTEDKQAILRSRDIHHRNETYTGLADSDLFLGYKFRGLFKAGDILFARLGTTIPTGRTEENPWKLGDAGIEHLHIQFGTGTFNPIVNLRYSLPLYRGMMITASTRGTFPFYENSKTYRGPVELSYTAGFMYRLFDWLSFNGNYLGFYQSAAIWDGERDINTGLRYSMAALGMSLATLDGITVSANVMFPLTQETLYDEGDAIEFGNLVSLTTTYSF
ncbi:restriction endonuclease subunit S [Candidatus Poribacteria bacterium]|nr:restriction endonuclease subunit S [Candidatus Poribacteria bacterium]